MLLLLNSIVSVYLHWPLCIEEGRYSVTYFISSISNGKEKAPYEAKAAKRKAEYEKLINAYNNKQVSILYWLFCCLVHWFSCLYDSHDIYFQASTADDVDEESDKSKSEINDEEDEASGQVVSLFTFSYTFILLFTEY